MQIGPVYGLGSHIGSHVEILNIELGFFVTSETWVRYFCILLFFIDLFTIFGLITILSVNYGNHWLPVAVFR